MANIITVSLDLDALREHVRKVVKDNGSLESSGGIMAGDLDNTWDAMKSLFTGVNEEFGNAVSDAVMVLVEEDEENDIVHG